MGTVFRHLNLTSKIGPTQKELKLYCTHNIGVQLKRKELLRHLRLFKIEKNHFGLHGLSKNISNLTHCQTIHYCYVAASYNACVSPPHPLIIQIHGCQQIYDCDSTLQLKMILCCL